MFDGEHNTASNNVFVDTTVPIDVERAPDTLLENNTLPVASPSPIVTSPSPSSTPTLTPEPTLISDPNFIFYTGLALLIIIVAGFAVFLLTRKHKQ